MYGDRALVFNSVVWDKLDVLFSTLCIIPFVSSGLLRLVVVW